MQTSESRDIAATGHLENRSFQEFVSNQMKSIIASSRILYCPAECSQPLGHLLDSTLQGSSYVRSGWNISYIKIEYPLRCLQFALSLSFRIHRLNDVQPIRVSYLLRPAHVFVAPLLVVWPSEAFDTSSGLF